MSGKDSKKRDHCLIVALPAELRVGLSKIEAKYENSIYSAVLLMITKGLNSENVISQENFSLFHQRYTRKLVDVVQQGRENSHIPKLELEKQRREQCQVSTQKLRENERLQGAAAALKGMWDQWEDHRNLSWRLKVVAYAKKFQDNEYAKLIIAKEKECDIISQGEGA